MIVAEDTVDPPDCQLRLSKPFTKHPGVIATGRIESCGRIVSKDAILCNQYRCERFGVFKEERIMANTEPNQDIEIGFFPVKDSSLNNGAAHWLEVTDSYLFVFLEAQGFLGCSPCFANNGYDIKSLCFQDSS